MWKNQNSHFVEDMIQLCKITYYCLLESGTIPCTFSNNQHGSLSHALKTCFTWCNAVANLKTVHNADHSFTKATRYFLCRSDNQTVPVSRVFIDQWNFIFIWSKMYCGLIWKNSLNHAYSPLVCHMYCPYTGI
jgi:hypothetical protein